MSETCHGCGAPIPPSRGGRPRKWCSEECRKAQYAASCIDCGGPTNGSNGRGPNAAKRCLECSRTLCAERNARIFEAWDRGETGKVIAKREGMSETAVHSLIVNHRGRNGEPLSRHKRVHRELWPLIERRWHEGATCGDIARETGTTPENISWMVHNMRAAGINLPRRQKVAA